MNLRVAYITTLVTLIFFMGITVYAAGDAQFEPLVGIPGITDTENATLPQYINSLYMVLITVGGMIAVVRIVYAGVKYSLTDIVTNKGEAKDDIKGVLLGLVLLLLPWVVLNTIYPELTNLDILRGTRNLPSTTQRAQNQTLQEQQQSTQLSSKDFKCNTDRDVTCENRCIEKKGTIERSPDPSVTLILCKVPQ